MQEENVKDSATVNSLRMKSLELARPWYGPSAPYLDMDARLFDFVSSIRYHSKACILKGYIGGDRHFLWMFHCCLI